MATKAKKPTFKQSREVLFAGFQKHGWTLHLWRNDYELLKTPYVTKGNVRLNFHPQAIYFSGHSLVSDYRDHTYETLIDLLRYRTDDDLDAKEFVAYLVAQDAKRVSVERFQKYLKTFTLPEDANEAMRARAINLHLSGFRYLCKRCSEGRGDESQVSELMLHLRYVAKWTWIDCASENRIYKGRVYIAHDEIDACGVAYSQNGVDFHEAETVEEIKEYYNR